MYQLHDFPPNATAALHMLLEEIGGKYGLVPVDLASSRRDPANVSDPVEGRNF